MDSTFEFEGMSIKHMFRRDVDGRLWQIAELPTLKALQKKEKIAAAAVKELRDLREPLAVTWVVVRKIAKEGGALPPLVIKVRMRHAMPCHAMRRQTLCLQVEGKNYTFGEVHMSKRGMPEYKHMYELLVQPLDGGGSSMQVRTQGGGHMHASSAGLADHDLSSHHSAPQTTLHRVITGRDLDVHSCDYHKMKERMGNAVQDLQRSLKARAKVQSGETIIKRHTFSFGAF
jgi:hypothetical protein